MCFACWINMATHTQAHTHAPMPTHIVRIALTHAHIDKYAIVIAFPRQQWFCERVSVLRYTHIVSLVYTLIC
jgi:hypothetical protein